MKSIFRKVRGKKSKKSKAQTPNISYKTSTESSQASGAFHHKPQHHDDDDRTYPMQEQSPTYSNVSTIGYDGQVTTHNDTSKRGKSFSFRRRTSDPDLQKQPRPLPNSKRSVNGRVPPQRITAKSKKAITSRSPSKRTPTKRAPSKRSVSSPFKSLFSGSSASPAKGGDKDSDVPQSQTERIARAAAALDNRGNELFERGYYDKAMECYSKALKLKRRTFHSMLEEADELFKGDDNDDGDGVDNGDDSNNGKPYDDFDESKTDPKLLVSMATSINNIGYLRQRSGKATLDETMSAYKKSLRIKRKILGKDSLSVGKTLNNIGSVHYLKREFPLAITAYEEGLEIMKSNLGHAHPDVATVMSNMGDVRLQQKKHNQALDHYRAALNVRWNAFGEHDPRVVRLLEKIAKIEIGDNMAAMGTTEKNKVTDWDESQLFDMDIRPLGDELQLLHNEVQKDVQYVDLLEKKMAIDMVKDKCVILKGMRDLIDEMERGGKEDDDDIRRSSRSLNESFRQESKKPASSGRIGGSEELSLAPKPTAKEVAKKRVQERLAQLRSTHSASFDNDDGDNNASNKAGNKRTMSKIGHASLPNFQNANNGIFPSSYYQQRNQRAALSTLQPDEIKGEVDSIRSAIKLREGIASLRNLKLDQEAENNNQGTPAQQFLACQEFYQKLIAE